MAKCSSCILKAVKKATIQFASLCNGYTRKPQDSNNWSSRLYKLGFNSNTSHSRLKIIIKAVQEADIHQGCDRALSTDTIIQ